MFPLIFHYRNYAVPTYGFAFFIAFLVVTVWAGFRVRKAGMDPDICPKLAFVVILCSMVSARIASIIHHLGSGHALHLDGPMAWFNLVFGGGMIAYGGVLGGILSAYFYLKKAKIDFAAYADAYAPALGLGVAIMRIGCFCAGCCWGRYHVDGLSVDFLSTHTPSPAAIYQYHQNLPGLFPIQLLASLDGLVIMGILLWAERRKLSKGVLISGFFLLYSFARFFEDFGRYYPDGDRALGLTYNQWISIGVVTIMTFIFLRRRNSPAPASSVALHASKGLG